MPQRSRRLRQELAQVCHGLTLACINIGVTSVPHNGERFAAAVDHAWRRWPPAHKFAALTRSPVSVGEHVWEEISRFGRRAAATDQSSWRPDGSGTRLLPIRSWGAEPLTEVLDTIGDVGGHGWDGLAMMFAKQVEDSDSDHGHGSEHLCKP